ncbi:hypothetical protein CO661_14230 [Sinorhizobium fredii]|uniref:Cell wall hydrolase SleB domain-containing protein n=1 Tax=Rhizobium fredii TaxID=380 RepID=A0A2A6LYM8_RHIFR|nr:cell wall hydrolase [Sinorhizobium fredii]PDT47336.1 hypothetical protein CO661_14230 [Sinorhizobium fredii]
MANVHLTQRDIDYIARVVDTEVPRSIQRRNPAEYNRMVRAVVDTVTNRMASGQFPSSATGVLNQRRQFSKITGPSSLDPYGSVQQTPRAPAAVKNLVADHVASRAAGAPPTIGGALNYANPNFSSKSNLGWIGDMINAGAQKLGIGNAVHYHGTAPGSTPVGDYSLTAESMPGSFVARPTPRGGLFQSEQATGIMSAIDPATPMAVERQDLGSFPVSARASAGAGLLSNAATGVTPEAPRDRLRRELLDQKRALEAQQAQQVDQTAQVGSVTPFADPAPKLSLAEQYSLYGQGQAAARNMGLLAQDVAAFSPQLHPVQQAPSVEMTDLPPVGAPEAPEVPGPVTAYAEPTVAAGTPAAAATNAAIGGGGLLSPQEYEMVRQQQVRLNEMGPNRRVQMGNFAKGALTRIGGGILGGMLLGPLGAVAGGLLAPSAVNAMTRKDGFPDKPKSTPKGDGKMTEYGRDAYRDSRQFRDAWDKGGIGLY